MIKLYKEELTIIGGEPTLHPDWKEIVDLLYFHEDIQFRVNTNGRQGHKQFERPKIGKENFRYVVDNHP